MIESETAKPDGAALTPRLMVTLALLSTLGPIATDMYLPSFPRMVHELSTTSTMVQLSLTAFMIGSGFGQLMFGWLSDRLGRVGPLVAGNCLFTIFSICAALAPNIEVLDGLRFMQGLTAACGMAIGRAIVRDIASGDTAARTFSLLQMLGGLVIVGAPLLGSVLAGPIGWRGVLYVVAGTGVVATVLSAVAVPETNPSQLRRERGPRGSSIDQLRRLRRRSFVGYNVVQISAFATLIAYVSASPFIYQKLMGLTTIENGVLFAFNGMLLALTSGLSARLSRRRSIRLTTRNGLTINLVAIVVIALVAFSGAPAWLLAVPIMFTVASVGLVFGNATALALAEIEPEISGFASGVMGITQSFVSGIVAPLVGLGGEHTAVPLAIVMLVASGSASAMLFVVGGGRGLGPESGANGAESQPPATRSGQPAS